MVNALSNNLNCGANGNEVTAGASGGACGDAFAVSGSGITFTNDNPFEGALAARVNVASGVSVYRQWSLVSNATVRGQMYVRRKNNMTVFSPFWVFRGASVQQMVFGFDTSGHIKIQNTLGVDIWTSTTVLPINTNDFYRIDFWATRGTSTTGQLKADIYLNNSLTPLETGVNLSNVNLGTNDWDQMRVGAHGTPATARQFDFDMLRIEMAEASYFSPFGVNLPPTVDAGTNKTVAAGGTASLTATANDTDGTIASISWAFTYNSVGGANPTLTGGTTLTPSFTVTGTAGNLYILEVTVTDDDGATSTDTVEVRVPSATTVGTLPGDGTGGAGWSIFGGAATQGAALGDGSGTTGVESPDLTTTENARRWRLRPMNIRTDLTLYVDDVLLTEASTDNSVFRLYSGSTLITTRDLDATTSSVDKTFALTSPELAAITDWGALYGEVGASS